MNTSRFSVKTLYRALLAVLTCAAMTLAQEGGDDGGGDDNTVPKPNITTGPAANTTVAIDSQFVLSVTASLTNGEKTGLDTIFIEDFEVVKSWDTVNGSQTNKWFVGNKTFAGSGTTGKSAYISSDGGETYDYDKDSESIVHIYFDVTFPASDTPYTLSFKWKGMGEASSSSFSGLHDYLRVFLVGASTTPTAGTPLSLSDTLRTLRGQSDWRDTSLTIPAVSTATKKRLVFSWVNDVAGAGNPPSPAAVDNILITYPVHSTLSYQWYKGTSNTIAEGDTLLSEDGKKSHYTVPTAYPDGLTALVNKYYYCIVTNTVNQDSEACTSSVATVTVKKKAAPTNVASPALEYRTMDTVRLAKLDGYQYAIYNSNNWQDSSVFAGLTEETSYSFHQRIKATLTTDSSLTGSYITVTTSAFPGHGTAQNPYLIGKPVQLAKVAGLVNSNTSGGGYDMAYYKLTDNIPLTSYPSWTPIGTANYPFKGVFDGDNKTVTNLNISSTNNQYSGLFGYINGGTVKNLGVASGAVNATYDYYNSYVGGVASYVMGGGTIENCYVSASVTGGSGTSYVGGVVGYVTGGSVTGSYSTGEVTGTYAGGVAGYVTGSGSLTGSYSTGAVTGSAGTSYVGGVAGYVTGSGSVVTGSYATGAVTGSSEYGGAYTGGVAGYVASSGSVTSSYATGAITGYSAGGVAGYINNGSVTSSYATGAITGYYAGGVTGYINSGSVTNSAALNINVQSTYSSNNSYFGRVVGNYTTSYTTLSGNIAFYEMGTADGASFSGAYLATGKDGAEMTAAGLKTADGFPEAFTDAEGPWTYAAGKLPGLLGAAVDMPAHIDESTAAFAFDGYGTLAKPYEIKDLADLEKLSELVNAGNGMYSGRGKYYKLMDDIDMSDDYGEDGASWVPIGSISYRFKGYFDGNSKKITGLYVSTSDTYAGLFGYIDSGTVKNLGIEGGRVISENQYVGGLAGFVTGGGVVENCYVTASVTSSYSRVGGVVGAINNGSVKSSYSTGAVSGSDYVGGVVGLVEYDYSGTMNNIITNCAALNPSVNGSSYVGRVVGNVSSSYYTTLTGNVAFRDMVTNASNSSVDGVSDKTASELKTADGFPDVFKDDPWVYEEGKLPGFGAAVAMPEHIKDHFGDGEQDGTEDSPYEISTAEDLKKLADKVNEGSSAYSSAYYKLTQDIDLSEDYGVTYNDGKGWIPIGSGSSFSGVFDGNNKKITGLYINNTDLKVVGLFGSVDGGTVKNLGIEGGSVTGGYYSSVGGVVGSLSLGNTGISIVGTPASVENCYTTCAVTGGSSSYVGGVVGYMTSYTNVTSSYSTGAVTGGSSSYAGGVVGYAGTGSGVYSSSVANCAALNPSVKGGSYAGRVIGYYTTSTNSPTGTTLTGNVAFGGMVTNGGTSFGSDNGATTKNGATKTVAELKTAAGFPTALTADPWVYEDGKLPGFVVGIDMPSYMAPAAIIYRVVSSSQNDTLSGVSDKAPRAGETLRAGLVNGGTTLTYKWKFSGVEIGTQSTYTVAADYVGGAITLEITESGTVYTARTAAVRNEPRPSSPSSPTEDYSTARSIKLVEIEGYEYAIAIETNGAKKWQKSPMFTGLSPNTQYYFYQRVAETKSAYASESSSYRAIRTKSQQYQYSAPEALVKLRNRAEVPEVQPAGEAAVTAAVTVVEAAVTEAATVVTAPAALAGEFTAGPNPVQKQSGNVNFYRKGKQVTTGELRVYDANGNTVNSVKISDMAIDNQSKRIVGSWNLRDKNGRAVSEGTYLAKGVLKTVDGKVEKISLIISVR